MKRLTCIVVYGMVLAFATKGDASEVQVNAQDLRSALIELSAETGLTIVAPDQLIEGRKSPGAYGSPHANEALNSILQGTGLQARFQNTTAVIVSQGNNDPFDLGTITIGAAASASEGVFDLFEEERSIQTLNAEELEKQNITDLGDALERTPNVFVTGRREPIALQLSVRGISNLGGGFSGPTVGLFVDGVLLNSVVAFGNANPPLFDVESVDVFLGPQTTTFSRITTAGAVNVVTKKPTDKLEFSLEGDIGRFDTGSDFAGSTTLVGNVPLLKDGRLSARLVVFETRNDGFISTRGRDLVGRPTDKISDKSSSVRLSLRSRPREDLTLDFQFTYTEVEYDSIWGSLTNLNLLQLGQYVAFVDPAGPERADDYLARFEVAYDTDIGTFKSMTSFRGSYTASDTDAELVPTIDLSNAGFNRNIDTLSQEFTYTGLPLEIGALPGEVTMNAGLSVSYTETFGAQIITFGPAISNLVPGVTPEEFGGSYGYSRQRALNTGLYGDIAWRPTPPLELSAGLRFAYDRFKFERESVGVGLSNLLGLAEVAPFASVETAFTAFSPRVAVSYDWSDTLTTYASYSEGQRPGGVSLFSDPTGLAVNFYDKEITRNVELGVRSLFYDGLLGVNATAFFTKIEDFQLPVEVIFPGTLIPPRSLVDNVGDGTAVTLSSAP
ncbi:MAG: TonB-dependent receptor [Pseudomonadota bacterium]